MRRGTLTFSMRELAGALGDYGTFLPFAVGYITVCGLDPAGFLLVMGLANILTGLWVFSPERAVLGEYTFLCLDAVE
jgi:Molybdate transporter of MFS superfamily